MIESMLIVATTSLSMYIVRKSFRNSSLIILTLTLTHFFLINPLTLFGPLSQPPTSKPSFTNIMILRYKTHSQIINSQFDNDSTFIPCFFLKVKILSNFKYHFKYYYQQHKIPFIHTNDTITLTVLSHDSRVNGD
jgi:hypothetical protein